MGRERTVRLSCLASMIGGAGKLRRSDLVGLSQVSERSNLENPTQLGAGVGTKSGPGFGGWSSLAERSRGWRREAAVGLTRPVSD